MRLRGGKAVAIVIAALAVAALAAAGFVLRRSIAEGWWLHRLGSDDPAVRKAAAERLAAFPSARAIPELLDLIEAEQPRKVEEDPDVDACAAPPLERLQGRPLFGALERCVNGSGPRAAPALREYLARGKGDLPVLAAQVLHDLEPGSREALAVLRRAVGDEAEDVRDWALGYLLEVGRPPVAELIEGLREEDPEFRLWATREIGRIGPRAEAAAPALKTALQDPDLGVRVAAAAALLEMDGDRKALLPVLLAGLGRRGTENEARDAIAALGVKGDVAAKFLADMKTREVSVETCLDLIDGEPEAVGFLAGLIRDGTPAEKNRAMAALAALGPAAADAVPAVAAALADDEFDVAAAAAGALARIGPAPECLRSLLEFLDRARTVKSRDAFVSAAEALGKLGPAAAPAVPLLAGGLADESASVRGASAKALIGIGPAAREAIGPLEELAKETGPDGEWSRLYATAALIAVDPARRPALLPELIRCLDRPGSSAAILAAEALGRLRAREALPALLRRGLGSDYEGGQTGRYHEAIRKIGIEDLTPVRTALKGAGESQRRAFWLVEEVGPAAAAAVSDLVKFLGDRDPDLRSAAARALGRIGPDARPAIAYLEALKRDGSREVRREARLALARLRPLP